MNCFKHPQTSAHGICRVCCRGVCDACSADLGHSLACKDEHEQAATEMHALASRSTKLLKTSRKSIWIAPVFFTVTGALFAFDGTRQASPWNFGTYLGAAFIVFALAILTANLRAYGGKDAE